MTHTVRVDFKHVAWDRQIKKYYRKVTTYLVSDPQDSLREGDVIEFSSGYRKGRHVRHVVERIVKPFGVPIENRPPVLSRQKRDTLQAEKRLAKLLRRQERRKDAGSGSGVHDGNGMVGHEYVGRIRKLVLERVGRA